MIKKLRFLKKPGAFIPLALFVLILLFVGIFAITQETDEVLGEDELAPEEMAFDFLEEREGEEDPLPEWLPPGPPRWFRSNAGGMTLEETPSRLAALRNKYALVIDYVAPYEIDPRLAPYFFDEYTVEIRVLYDKGRESRRQWLFKDEYGNIRLNAVFKPPPDAEEEELPDDFQADLEQIALEEAEPDDELGEEFEEEFDDELADIIGEEGDETAALELPDNGIPDPQMASAELTNDDEALTTGFIEIFTRRGQIIEDRWLYDDGCEIVVTYIYNRTVLTSTETEKVLPDVSTVKMYTDSYRYNRAFSLRRVERVYHADTVMEPVRLTFPYRVLEEASYHDFMGDKLFITSDFFGNYFAGEGFRMVYDTDSRGRILTQTLLDDQDEMIWAITNTWSGDRIVSALKIEGEDERLSEYEYNGEGKRIVQRDIRNGVLERLVYAEGEQEIEELYLDGVIAMRAYWEDGRKISEERVRR